MLSLANQLLCLAMNTSNFLMEVKLLISSPANFNSLPQIRKSYYYLRIGSGFLPANQIRLAGYPQNAVTSYHMLFPAQKCVLDTTQGVSSSRILRLATNLTFEFCLELCIRAHHIRSLNICGVWFIPPDRRQCHLSPSPSCSHPATNNRRTARVE